MPAIRRTGQQLPSATPPQRRSARLSGQPVALPDTYKSMPRPAAAPQRLASLPAPLRPQSPANSDHVHAAQARFVQLNTKFKDEHALAILGSMSTDNLRLTRKLPAMRHHLHALMLQCLPMARGDSLDAVFKERRADLNRFIEHVADIHSTALSIEERLEACARRADYAALPPLRIEFQILTDRANKAFNDNLVLTASLQRHLAEIKTHHAIKPPVIAPWHLLVPMEVSADKIKDEHCPLSMTEAEEITEPVALPLGEGIQIYSRLELEMWLQTSKLENVNEYMFRNPTSSSWVKLSQLRRLIILPIA